MNIVQQYNQLRYQFLTLAKTAKTRDPVVDVEV